MSLRTTLGDIRADYGRYKTSSPIALFEVILFSQGFWASFVHRLTRAIYLNVKIPILRQILRFLSKVAIKFTEVITGISLPVGCNIGSGLYIGHFGNVILHPKTQMGKNCNLSQGVTIGIIQRGKRQGVPKLGDRVFVGPNAVVLGGITVGDDAAIGAGAIVTRSIPPRAVVAGNPAKILSYEGSFEFIKYEDVEHDQNRLASLRLREIGELTQSIENKTYNELNEVQTDSQPNIIQSPSNTIHKP